MPSFEASTSSIERLSKKTFDEKDLEYAKTELDGAEGDKIKLKAADTNRPDLWSEEGIARVIRGIHGSLRGMPKLAAKKGTKKILVDFGLEKVRPFVSGFVAEGISVTDDMLRSMINMQENLSENYGRKRKTIAIGIYAARR